MNEKQLFKEIGFLDDDLIEEAENSQIAKKTRIINIKWVGIGACLALFFGLSMIYFYNQKSDINLVRSSGNVRVKYIDNAPDIMMSASLTIALTEEEILNSNTSIFKGTIEEIQNIEIKISGITEYRAIATIKIEKVYRGTAEVGETVTILLPCAINNGTWTEDTEVVSEMRVGMKGIFMPIKYDETSVFTVKSSTLFMQDLADYGFLDGVRYTFLETPNGLLFAKDVFQSVGNATSLEEVEEYIKQNINNKID